jgi:hypothetical protein
MDMDMQHGHGYAAWGDMQHGQLDMHEYAASKKLYSKICSIDMGMQRGYRHAA